MATQAKHNADLKPEPHAEPEYEIEAYARTAQAPKDVDAVELLGGASRVPRLQAELVKALGGRQLDKCVIRSHLRTVLDRRI